MKESLKKNSTIESIAEALEAFKKLQRKLSRRSKHNRGKGSIKKHRNLCRILGYDYDQKDHSRNKCKKKEESLSIKLDSSGNSSYNKSDYCINCEGASDNESQSSSNKSYDVPRLLAKSDQNQIIKVRAQIWTSN